MYSAEERKIFKFWDGTKDRFIDPIASLRSLMSQPEFDFDADTKLADSGDKDAIWRVIRAAREVFGLKEFGEENGQPVGTLDTEAIAILQDFVVYVQELQKKTESSPTSPVTSDLADGSITKPLSDCGSIAIVS